jgi:alpha-galactosidase
MGNLSRRDAGKVLLAGYAGLLVSGREAVAAAPTMSPAVQANRREATPSAQAANQVWQGQKPALNSTWCDVLVNDKEAHTVSYRTNWVVYEESFLNGQLVGRGWNGAGFINFYDGRLSPDDYREPEAFRLDIDGQSLTNNWEWGGVEKSTTSDGFTEVVVKLTHKVRPVTVKVHTKLDGTPVLTRWLEITNTGQKPAALAAVSSWSGVLRRNDRWRAAVSGSGSPLYSLGYFEGTHWGEEGSFEWHDMPSAGYQVDGRFRREQWRHPIFMLRNNATGEFFIGQLAWTGGYTFEFDLNPEIGKDGDAAALTFAGGPSGLAPLRVIAPNETVSSPEMHLGLVYGDLDAAVQAMHTHLRRSVLMAPARGQRSWIESGIGPELEITTEQVNHAIDVAAKVGAEIFFIDASWYAAPGGNWWATVGDWDVSRQRFPEGLKSFRDKVHAAGMLWGLWMDAERVGAASCVAKEHPDWLAMNYDGNREMGGLLDLTNPEAAKWMESQMVRVIEENELDFFRLDYNTDPGRGIEHIADGYVENGYWRYYEVVYGVYERLRARFPKVIFENCAGGGARTDIGMVRRFNHTDVTDWQIAPRSFMITNGMTMALPPETVDRLLGGQAGHTAADFDFQSRLLLFMEPKFGFLYPIGAPVNPIFMERTRHWIETYKNFVRPFIATSLIYHHTPTVTGMEPRGWGVLEMGAEDQSRAICALFQLSMPSHPEYRLYPRSLDVSKRYRVMFDNSGRSTVVDGYTLVEQGLLVRLEGALTSELLLFEAV